MGITQNMVKENLNIESVKDGKAYRIYMFEDGTFGNKDNFDKGWEVKVKDGEESDMNMITSILSQWADIYFSIMENRAAEGL